MCDWGSLDGVKEDAGTSMMQSMDFLDETQTDWMYF